MGMIVFFILVGLYFIVGLVFDETHLGIFDGFSADAPIVPAIIKSVNLDADLLADDKYKALELSEGYVFDINALAVGKNNPFEPGLGGAGSESKK